MLSPAAAPPEELAPPVPALPEEDSLAAFSVSPELAVEPGCVAPLEDVEPVLPVLPDFAALAALCSALVSAGGVISGVFLGTVSETLLPPHALSEAALSAVAAHTASARRALTAGPCACRRSGSR